MLLEEKTKIYQEIKEMLGDRQQHTLVAAPAFVAHIYQTHLNLLLTVENFAVHVASLAIPAVLTVMASAARAAAVKQNQFLMPHFYLFNQLAVRKNLNKNQSKLKCLT